MSDDNQVKVQIKGVREGLLVTLGEGSWPEVEATLLQHIKERQGFFQGARVALDVGPQVLRAAEMGALRDRLSEGGVILWAILGNSPATEQNAQTLGLATRLAVPKAETSIKPLDTNLPGEESICLQRTLRSGFKVSFPGHVLIIGDVNPGAEIVAGGNVVVWGRLRGVVHAGAEGDEQALVCALDLMPTQLRIAGYIAVTPKRKGKPLPEVAKIKDGQVIAEPWEYKEGR